MNIKIAPSILSADFVDIKQAISDIEKSNADWIHCDIMDGYFVPNISFGSKMIADIRQRTNLTLDAHLMVINPIRYVETFAKSGADNITVHLEACQDNSIIETLQAIRMLGKKCGVVIKPETDTRLLMPILDYCDIILLMSVQPGFSGQSFLPNSIQRLQQIKSMITNQNIQIEVDGGINEQNAAQLIQEGANILVVGNTFFGAKNRAEIVKQLKKATELVTH